MDFLMNVLEADPLLFGFARLPFELIIFFTPCLHEQPTLGRALPTPIATL